MHTGKVLLRSYLSLSYPSYSLTTNSFSKLCLHHFKPFCSMRKIFLLPVFVLFLTGLASAQPIEDDLPQITGCIALVNARVVASPGKAPVVSTVVMGGADVDMSCFRPLSSVSEGHARHGLSRVKTSFSRCRCQRPSAHRRPARTPE